MKKIILESHGREINISALQEIGDIHGVIDELIVPALTSAGFHEDTVLDGFSNFVYEREPLKNDVCSVCGEKDREIEYCNDCFMEAVKDAVIQNIQGLKAEYDKALYRIKELEKTNEALKEHNGKLASQIKHFSEEDLNKIVEAEKNDDLIFEAMGTEYAMCPVLRTCACGIPLRNYEGVRCYICKEKAEQEQRELKCHDCGHWQDEQCTLHNDHRDECRRYSYNRFVKKVFDEPKYSLWDCPNCKVTLGEDTSFCPYCFTKPDGTDVPREVVPRAVPTPRATPEPNIWGAAPAAPEPQVMGMWNTEEVAKEIPKREPVRTAPARPETDMDCPYCGANMDARRGVANRGEYECPECEYATNCLCFDCQEKRGEMGIPQIELNLAPNLQLAEEIQHGKQPILQFNVSEEDRKKNVAKCRAELARVQHLADTGNWGFGSSRGRKIDCSNAHKFFGNINCKDKKACTLCPVGSEANRRHANEYGYYFCGSCHRMIDSPFPAGHCPLCGIHEGDGHRDGLGEYCNEHWDVHRPHNDYIGDEEQNTKYDKNGKIIGSYDPDDDDDETW